MSGRPFTAAFYGDDLTGSTDALAQFHRAGLRGLLLTSHEEIGLGAGYDVIGVAGISRSLPAGRMAGELLPVFRALREVTSTVVQYKVCSTADSSPAVGSLGRAIELGREVFGEVPVPVLIAQPDLGRYTAFGNHFAAEGGVIYRLDRQPTMSRHPSTPMTEGDLRRHIGAQTGLPVASVDVTAYSSDPLARYRAVAAGNPGAIVLDATDNDHLRAAAGVILAAAHRRPAFALGSGGLSWGLGTALARTEAGAQARARPAGPPGQAGRPDPVPRLLVVSGSCSPQTARQIRWAMDQGWTCLPLDDGAVTERMASGLRDGPGVVVYSSLGPPPGDRDARDRDPGSQLDRIGGALGRLTAQALGTGLVARVVVVGGDTSGRVLRAIGASAMEIVSILGGGLVLSRLRSPGGPADGAEIVFKGGQLGPDDLFGRVRTGERLS